MKAFSDEYPVGSEVLAILNMKYPGHEDCPIMPYAMVKPLYEMGCINHHSHFIMTFFEMDSIQVRNEKIYAKIEKRHTHKARFSRWLVNRINRMRIMRWATREGWESISIPMSEIEANKSNGADTA